LLRGVSRGGFEPKKPRAIGIKAPYPGFIEPALATSVEKVPSGARWIHEIKFDGYRVQVHLRDAAVKSSPAAATTGQTALEKLPQTPGTSMRAAD